MSWLNDPVTAAMMLPPVVLPLLVFAAALLEYVFPPFWGDFCVLLGFFLSAQGAASAPLIFVAAVAGSTAGAVIAYSLGRRYGLALIRWVVLRRGWRSKSRRRAKELFQRFGERVLAANRFLPVIRGAMLYGAGAFRLRFWRSLAYCGLSNLAFMTFLLWVAHLGAGSWDELQTSARHYNQILGVAMVAAFAAATATMFIRLRLARAHVGQLPASDDV